VIKKVLLLLTSLIITLSLATPAFAYSSYVGGDKSFTYAQNRMDNAKYCFSNTGYGSPVYYHLTDFYKSTIQNQVPLVRAFYTDSHGTSDGKNIVTHESDDTNAFVSNTDMYNWTLGFYKFVYLDACDLGDTDVFFKAFNMNYGDGLNHALLAWNGTITDGTLYTAFSARVFSDLRTGETVNDAVWNARTSTGITNYAIYGNYSTTMTN